MDCIQIISIKSKNKDELIIRNLDDFIHWLDGINLCIHKYVWKVFTCIRKEVENREEDCKCSY